MAACGSPVMMSLSSLGPGLLFLLRLGLVFVAIMYYYQCPGLRRK